MTVDGRVLTVNSEGSSKLDVYNVIGSLEKSLQLETGEVSVELQPGVHIIRLTTSSHENYTLKAIIK